MPNFSRTASPKNNTVFFIIFADINYLDLIAMRKMMLLAFAAMALTLVACQKTQFFPQFPSEPQKTFSEMYPNARFVEWEHEYGGFLKAEFRQDGYEKEAWFNQDGTWLFTKTDLPVRMVPAVVSNAAMSLLGSDWYIDDADHFLTSETPEEYYELDCEKRFTEKETRLRILPDGTVI